MRQSQRTGRERKMLLAVVAVSSGVTLSCCGGSGPPRYPDGIGLFDSGWNELFDAAARDAGQAATDAGADAQP